MMVNSVVASPAVNVRPEVPTTAIPKRSGSTPWTAGYTVDGTPSRWPPESSPGPVDGRLHLGGLGSRPADV